ncbi:uncharacterized protein LOC142231844 [Haematobia irritans]|uniref:uncharacterized protein LOC142231844 n=1 Tax=Haematobia irritans TaxID=7368 RepID=UPI003F4F8133
MVSKQLCRICRTDTNLKYSVRELRELNKAQGAAAGTDKASLKLLRTTPTLGNICKECDDRIQIFDRLDDANVNCDSDIEIEDAPKIPLPPLTVLPTLNNCRPDTPIIVDDDDMLYDIFKQKFDQQRQQRQQHANIDATELQRQPQAQSQQFISQFNPPYTPPQSNGGSEGDDAKVTDALTSRESTPASLATTVTPVPSAEIQDPPATIDSQGHRIVAIIDLEEEDSCPPESNNVKNSTLQTVQNVSPKKSEEIVDAAPAKPQADLNCTNQILLTPVKNTQSQDQANTAQTNVSDDEEIVFRRVDPNLETPPSKKKKRKSYDENKLRLVASLSLVSSDSETEEPLVKKHKPNTASTDSTKTFTCNECNITLPDEESLKVHERIHAGIKCPECRYGFPQEKRLINHMRRKHRAYNGNMLIEKSRGPQDSAMTIRLRYMQTRTFYECQLCGRIDEVFKDHKEHIVNKHPMESKTLKDPMMKELKCPVCKTKCGNQYIGLCRHILEKHEYGQFKTHLRELLHVSSFGWSASRQQEVAKTARIFQFTKRSSLFFQCKFCDKIVAGYPNHVKHTLNKCKFARKKESVKKLERLEETTEKPKPAQNKAKEEKLVKSIDSTNKKKTKPKKDSKSCKKPTNSSKKSPNSKKSLIPKKPSAIVKKPKEPVKSEITKPVVSKTKSSAKSTPQAKTTEKSNKRKRKDESTPKVTKPLKKIVKVKAPIKQITLQTYKCSYCPKQLKGFILYNKHVLQEHMSNVYSQCTKCSKIYLNRNLLICHMEKCSLNIAKPKRKQKRKYVIEDDNEAGSVCNANGGNEVLETYVKCRLENTNENSDQQLVPEWKDNDKNLPALEEEGKCSMPLWLKDLFKLNQSKNKTLSDADGNDEKDRSNIVSININDNTANLYPPILKDGIQQCCYCLHLYPSELELKYHTRLQHTGHEEILVKFKPCNVKL